MLELLSKFKQDLVAKAVKFIPPLLLTALTFFNEFLSLIMILNTLKRRITLLITKNYISSIVIGLKHSYFPIIHLPSCHWTVCSRTVQWANHIESCSFSQPITLKVVEARLLSLVWLQTRLDSNGVLSLENMISSHVKGSPFLRLLYKSRLSQRKWKNLLSHGNLKTAKFIFSCCKILHSFAALTREIF